MNDKELTNDKNNDVVTWKNGIVAMLDILGVRDIPEERAKDFLGKLDILISQIEKGLSEIQESHIIFPKAQEPPELIVIGDTIIISWEPLKDAVEPFLLNFAYTLQTLVVLGLSLGLPIRGAISIGGYLKASQPNRLTVIGSAISDVAGWFEQSQWIGIIATPKCGLIIEKLQRETEVVLDDFFPAYYVEYPVPLKDGRNLPLWVVSWPRSYKIAADFHGEESPIINFLEDISQMSIPYGTEEKYFNTTEFYRWYEKNITFKEEET